MGLKKFICKDVRNQNEPKRGIVTLRIIYIVIMVAFLLDLVIAGWGAVKYSPYKIGLIFAAIIILFAITYNSSTKVSLTLFLMFTFIFSLSLIPCFGWSAGMQNYFITMLMMCYFAVHAGMAFKIVLTLLVLCVRIVTIFIYSGTLPETEISEVSGKMIQSVNISAVFLLTVIISYIYSHRENIEESKLMKYNDSLAREANTDRLTGLYNRRYASDYLDSVKKAGTLGAISICIGDIDFFKKVNDTYGHDAGDLVLKSMAEILRNECGENCLVSRWGGEEFLLIFSGVNGDDAFNMLDTLRKKIKNHVFTFGEQEISVTMTFGLTEYDFSGNIDKTIKEADEKLYRGKTGGRDRVVY